MVILVLGVVVIVLTGVVYLLATPGTKEIPYEEAPAEQRQQHEQEKAQVVKPEGQHKYKKEKVLTKKIFYLFFLYCIYRILYDNHAMKGGNCY